MISISRYSFWLIIILPLYFSCGSGHNASGEKITVDVNAFQELIAKNPDGVIVDVRTPEEYSKGHLIQSVNIDWNGNEFEKRIQEYDKSKPIFVYCLSGGRSTSAAKKIKTMGYSKIYELDGGIMKWRGSNLPEEKVTSNNQPEMTASEYTALYDNKQKLVLIDFYADWCAPCKKMKPYLEEISKDMASEVEVIRINADDHQSLCKHLQIDALPVLQLFKGNQLVWNHTGYIGKSDVVSVLKEQK